MFLVLERMDVSNFLKKTSGSKKRNTLEKYEKLHVESYSKLEKKINQYEHPQNVRPLEASTSKNGAKKYFCIYCKNLFSKITKHLEARHSEEDEVKKFIHLPKGNHERRILIDDIRKKGAFEFNTNRCYNLGKLIVPRRPVNQKSVDEYKVCPNCKGFFSKKTIRRHYPHCYPQKLRKDHNMEKFSKRVLGNVHSKASHVLKNEIFSVLRDDDVVRIIRYDELVIIYGNFLCEKYRSPHLHNMIRARLRTIGRFMLQIKKIDQKIRGFATIFQPQNFDNTIKAINNVAKIDETGQHYKSPATAGSLTTIIKFCCKLFITECIKKEDHQHKRLAEDFLCIFNQDVIATVNKTVEENQREVKRQKTITLPTMADIKKLTNYLSTNRRTAYQNLLKEFSFVTWLELASLTLTSIQIFNRRRAGEIERIFIKDFQTYQNVDSNMNEEVFKTLSPEGRKALQSYVRFVIRGKKARGVPVLLTNELVAALELIIKYRQEAKVSPDNPYVFGLPGSSYKHLSACQLMRQYSLACGAKSDKTLRGTELRKHLATQSVLLNLQENEVADLANFLGHAEKIHRDHYRLPIATREITEISRILEQAQGDDVDEEMHTEENVSGSKRKSTGTPEEQEGRSKNVKIQNVKQNTCITKEIIGQEIVTEQVVEEAIVQETVEQTAAVEHLPNLHVSENIITEEGIEPNELYTDQNIAKTQDGNHFIEAAFISGDKSNVEIVESGVKILEIIEQTENIPAVEIGPNFNEQNVSLTIGTDENTAPWDDADSDENYVASKSDTDSDSDIDTKCKRKRKPAKKWSPDQKALFNRKKQWTKLEKKTVQNLFSTYLDTNTLPPFVSCREAVTKHKELSNRTAKQLYAYINNNIKKKPKIQSKTEGISRKRWTTPEKTLIDKHFARYICCRILPPFHLCAEVKTQYPKQFASRTAKQLYAYVNNQISKVKEGRGKLCPMLVSESPSKICIRTYFKRDIARGRIPSPLECADVILKLQPLHSKSVNYVQECIDYEIRKNAYAENVRRALF